MHCTSHMGKRLLLLLLSIGCCLAGFAAESYTLHGRVIDRLTRRPVAYAAVVLDGQGDKGASTDSTGRFAIERSVLLPRSDRTVQLHPPPHSLSLLPSG